MAGAHQFTAESARCVAAGCRAPNERQLVGLDENWETRGAPIEDDASRAPVKRSQGTRSGPRVETVIEGRRAAPAIRRGGALGSRGA